ncbi:MAG: exopolysaccharide biosynthesis protein [Actinophytocola sp.]|nr:exopolysaccharide biosynthesis protein [Actinophytocola sp.]
MNDEAVRLSMLGQVLRRRWLALVALTILGAVTGAGASLVLSPGYTTTSQVLLRGEQEDTEFEAQARLVTSSTVLERAAAALGGDVTAAELRDVVDVEVPQGGLLEITGSAATPHAAQQLTDQAATQYVTFANELVTSTNDASTQVRLEQLEVLAQQVELTNDRIDRLHGAVARGALTLDSVRALTELESLRKDLAEAMAELEAAAVTPAGEEPLVIGPAPLPTSKAAPTPSQLIAAGAAAFLLLGGFGFLLAAHGDTRLRETGTLSAALGVPVTGTVPVPDERRGLLRRQRSVADGGDAATDPQCRRVLARLVATTGDELRLLLVAADDDPLARRAVARLAMAACAQNTRRTAVRIAHIDPADPMLDYSSDVSDAVFVVSPGTRTGWELIGIAMACADAGHPLAGSVIAKRVKQPKPAQQPDNAVGPDRDESLAGSS